MNDISYNDLYSMSDAALTGLIGIFIKHHRLNQNRTQDELARSAGVSRSTLSLLERGQSVTTSTLVQVLRVLNQLHVVESFRVNEEISPVEYARMQREKRKRAGSTRNK